MWGTFLSLKQHYDDTGRILSTNEAADLTEKYLQAEADKIAQTQWFETRAGKTWTTETQPSVEPKPSEQQSPAPKAKSKTLTNDQLSDRGTPRRQLLTRDESLEQMEKLLRWND